MPLSEAEVDDAANTLAVESRSLLGLPLVTSGSTWIKRLSKPPSALEFCRIVSRHIPVLIGKCLEDRSCISKWKRSSYLEDVMDARRVEVTLTPDGRADDVRKNDDGLEVFALPHAVQMTFKELFCHLHKGSPVAYLQSQNSNLTQDSGAGDLSPLLEDLIVNYRDEQRSSLFWVDEALGKLPEATNLWIGTEKSKTSMHRDHYENLFAVIRGTKVFTLYPPSEAYFLCDDLPYSVHQWKIGNDGRWKLNPSNSPQTPWIPIDPTEAADSARNRKYPRFAKALKPLVVEVHEGDTLYLPAGWYHHVAQRGDAEEGLCICVNWWYESDFAFSDRWALEAFVKEIGQAVRGEKKLCV